MSLLPVILFAAAAVAIGWRFRQIRDGRLTIWVGGFFLILALAGAIFISLYPDWPSWR